MELVDLLLTEPPQEITSRGRIGQATSTEHVHEGLVLSQEVKVLEAGSACEHVVGEGQDVIGFVIGLVTLEKL